MSAVILVIYTAVTGAMYSSGYRVERDWRPIGTFKDMAACEEAGRLLGAPKLYRCLPGAIPKEG